MTEEQQAIYQRLLEHINLVAADMTELYWSLDPLMGDRRNKELARKLTPPYELLVELEGLVKESFDGQPNNS